MTRTSANYRYFRKHFTRLVERHGGRMVVIARGRLVGSCPRASSTRLTRMVDRVRHDYPDEIPLVTPVPTLRELANPLIL